MEFLDLQIIGRVGKRDVTTPTFKAVSLTLFEPKRGKELRTLITGYELKDTFITLIKSYFIKLKEEDIY